MPGILGDGQQPLRSRAEPFGLQSLDPLSMSKVTASNQQLEFDSWFLKEALTCPTKKVGVILVFPEDLGGLLDSGPTSIWAYKVVSVAQRTSARLEILTMRLLGIFSNLANVCKSLHQGWPNLVSTVIDHISDVVLHRPLAEDMPMCQNTQSNERDFFRWFVPLTISNEPELKVLETVFFLV